MNRKKLSTLFAALLLPLLWASPICIEERGTLPIDLERPYKFGSLIVVPPISGVAHFRVNEQEPRVSVLGGQQLFSIGYDKTISFRGVFTDSPKGVHRWFDHTYPVENPDIRLAQELKLSKSTQSKLKKVSAAQRRHEAEVMRKIISQDNGDKIHLCHLSPVPEVMTSPFGKPRKLPNGTYYFHPGVDLRAREGEPIFTSAGGRVALVDHRGVSGNTVVIDHGRTLFTKYFHMSRTNVEEGQIVDHGTLLGLGGSTGRVTAAHLHWEVLFRGNRLDPLRFLKTVREICRQR